MDPGDSSDLKEYLAGTGSDGPNETYRNHDEFEKRNKKNLSDKIKVYLEEVRAIYINFCLQPKVVLIFHSESLS